MAERLVIDASVAAKWFLKDEEGADLADDLLVAVLAEDVEAHVPAIFLYEVSRLLTKATRVPSRSNPRLEQGKALEYIADLFEIPLTTYAVSYEECSEAAGMTVDYFKNFYDMTYVRLAAEVDCRVCTADEKIGASVPASFPHERIVLLEQLYDE